MVDIQVPQVLVGLLWLACFFGGIVAMWRTILPAEATPHYMDSTKTLLALSLFAGLLAFLVDKVASASLLEASASEPLHVIETVYLFLVMIGSFLSVVILIISLSRTRDLRRSISALWGLVIITLLVLLKSTILQWILAANR